MISISLSMELYRLETLQLLDLKELAKLLVNTSSIKLAQFIIVQTSLIQKRYVVIVI